MSPGEEPLNKPTREQLIVTAERLFAEHGLGVPLRRITQAARQKNESALQYHFGNRNGLIEAIFDLRMAPINARRMQRLDALAAGCGCMEIAESLVAPLAQGLCARDSAHYLRFLAQIQLAPSQVPASAWNRHYASIRRSAALFRDIRPELPRQIGNLRFRLAITAMVMHLADVEREGAAAPKPLGGAAVALRVDDLVQAIGGILLAPAKSSKL